MDLNTISDLANDLINGMFELNKLLEDNRSKIIKRKIRVKGKFKYQYLVRHNLLLDSINLGFPYFALRNIAKSLKESE